MTGMLKMVMVVQLSVKYKDTGRVPTTLNVIIPKSLWVTCIVVMER